MIVKTVNLTRIYQLGASAIGAVTNVNLEVEEGEFVGIFGPSGSGKTTLLNLIGLIDDPTSGTVFFKGQNTSLLSRSEKRKLRFQNIGFIFQTFNLFPTLTALENVELPLAFMKWSHQAQRKKAVHLLEAVGLTNRLDHKPTELSIGEMQRVAIARALVIDPSLILADEPTGELDSKIGSEIVTLLSDLCESHKTTTIVVTHDKQIVDVANTKYRVYDGVLTKII